MSLWAGLVGARSIGILCLAHQYLHRTIHRVQHCCTCHRKQEQMLLRLTGAWTCIDHLRFSCRRGCGRRKRQGCFSDSRMVLYAKAVDLCVGPSSYVVLDTPHGSPLLVTTQALQQDAISIVLQNPGIPSAHGRGIHMRLRRVRLRGQPSAEGRRRLCQTG